MTISERLGARLLDLERLLQCVASCSVIRYGVHLSTVNSDGIVCPPTYAAPKKGDPPYLPFRRAYIDGQQREIVVLDSPQSQSNRVELALLDAVRNRRIAYPNIEISFPADLCEPVYSVLQLSHRVYDAVLRACNFDGTPFFATSVGQSLLDARVADATALFVHAPATLVLGAWDSNGGGGPQSAKFPRLMTSEIVGLDAQRAELSATKFDPMDIRRNVAEMVATGDRIRRFELRNPAAKGSKKEVGKPSDYGFGSVPATAVARGAVINGALQTSVVSCSGLRQLGFPAADNTRNEERDQAGRAVLAALALFGLIAQNEAGYLLRSRCELLPQDAGKLELIGRTLQEIEVSALDTEAARRLLADACENARQHGLAFRPELLKLDADDRLIELVRRSRDAAPTADADVDG